MKKVFFVILMLFFPQIISTQIINEASLNSGNLIISHKSDSAADQMPGPVILEEPKTGNFFVRNQSDSTRWDVSFSDVLTEFYKSYPDNNYDFMVIFPTKPMISHWSIGLNRHIDGIGGGYGSYPPVPKLYSFSVIDFFPIWNTYWNLGITATVDSNLVKRLLIHEIAHYWLVNVIWPNHEAIGHWQYNLDLFNGDTRYVDPMAYYQWIIKGEEEICVNGNASATKFSDLSLYLMGLIPPDQVSPIYEHLFEPKPGNEHYNMWGPSLGESHKFTGTRTITIQDIINANGKRNPSYEESRKNFSAKFIIITAKGETVPEGFINYVKGYMDALPDAWYRCTGGRSKIGFLENPQIVLNKTDVDFGKVIAKSVDTDTLTITNDSSTPLIIDSIYTHKKYFTVFSRKDTVIKAGLLKLPVSFTPDTSNSYQDTLYIVNNSDTPLMKVYLKGSGVITDVVQNKTETPNKFGISQNYPNPFNPVTIINYQLPVNCHVTIKVYNMLGSEVDVLVNTFQTAGYYSLSFNAANLPSGVYFYRIETDLFSCTKKLLLLK